MVIWAVTRRCRCRKHKCKACRMKDKPSRSGCVLINVILLVYVKLLLRWLLKLAKPRRAVNRKWVVIHCTATDGERLFGRVLLGREGS